MAKGYRFSKKARAGIAKIWNDIATENPAAADELYLRIFDRIEAAVIHPSMGSPRPEFGRDARMLVEGNYKIVYVPAKDGILITAIVHARRLPSNWL